MEKFLVPRLEHLAFEVSFEEILSNLALCQDHHIDEEKKKTVKFASFLSPIRHTFTSEKLISFVRNHLDYYLYGESEMSDKMRYC